MPNAKVLAEKQAIVEELAAKLRDSAAGVLVDYKGISVANDTALRAELRKSGVNYAVVKNTLVRIAAEKVGFDALDPVLHGNTAMAVSADDPVVSAKILCDYAKKAGENKFVIKAGFVEGRVISAEEVKHLASLPSREILIATVLGTMNAPITGLVTVLSANISGLARVLSAIADQKAAA